MALDFPSNPVDGEIFDAYRWSAAKGVWQAVEEQAAVTITSPVAPTSGSPGDLWFNTNTGILFTYYSDGTSSQWVEVLSSAVPNVTEIMPSGTVTQTARLTAPAGWLLCEGQSVSRTTFARLFDAIGTTYGSGDGSTTFTLPNLQGRVPVGRDATQTEFDTLGETGGAKTVAITEAQMPSHSHTTPSHTHTFSGTTSTNGDHGHEINVSGTKLQYLNTTASASSGLGGLAGLFNNDNLRATNNGNHAHTYSGTTSGSAPTTNAAGSGQAHQNLQPYVVLNYIIKV